MAFLVKRDYYTISLKNLHLFDKFFVLIYK